MGEKSLAGIHQQTQVETETGNIQKNRYDAEGLRYELIENGRRISFVYHNGELLHEKGEESGLFQKETSYHYFTYDRQDGIVEEKSLAGIHHFTYNSLHQQIWEGSEGVRYKR
mgnify:CR=1 FL=1